MPKIICETCQQPFEHIWIHQRQYKGKRFCDTCLDNRRREKMREYARSKRKDTNGTKSN